MGKNRPSGSVPFWATDADYPAGADPWSAQPLIVEPTDGLKAAGFVPRMRPPAEWLNWAFNKFFGYLGYVADLPVVNWSDLYSTDVLGSALDTTHVRQDGTAKACYSEGSGVWLVPGSATSGSFYFGYAGKFEQVATGVAAPPHYALALYANGRNLLFDCDASGAGTSPTYAYSDVQSLVAWHKVTLPGVVVGSASVFDGILLPNTGTVIVCGGADTKAQIWRSVNAGVTFSSPIVVSTTGPLVLTRIFVGASNRIFVLGNVGSVTKGDRVFYSDDDGLTWTEGSPMGFDLIKEAIYLPDSGTYMFAEGTNVHMTTDPVAGSFTSVDLGTALSVTSIKALSSVNNVAVAIVIIAGLSFIIYSVDQGATWRDVAIFPGLGLSWNRYGQFCAWAAGALRFSLCSSGGA